MADIQIEVPYTHGYDFGVGVDQGSLSPMNKAVIDENNGVNRAGGAIVEFEVKRIRTTDDLQQTLNIDVDASVGSAAFGAGAEARFSFAKSSRIQKSSLFMAVRAVVSLEFLSIDEPKLTDAAKNLRDNPNAFGSRFGDMFVRGIQRGGLFIGILRVDTKDENESEEISTELEGSYGMFSASASTNFKSVQEKHQASTFVRMYHEGGPVGLTINDPSNPMELLDNVNRFLKAFNDNPDPIAIPYQVTLAPITIADGPLPPNAADMEHCQDVLRFCAKRRTALIDQLNLVDNYVDRAPQYNFNPGAPVQAFVQASKDTQDDLDLIADCASTAMNHPTRAEFPAKFGEGKGLVFPKSKIPVPLPTRAVAQPPVVHHDQKIIFNKDALQLHVKELAKEGVAVKKIPGM